MPGRIFAIGDIHGCARELEVLVESLRLARGDTIAFVGDYIDRGPDSRRVIDLLLDLGRRDDVRAVFLRGNHEDMCLAWLGRPGHWAEAWEGNGAVATLRSYGADVREGRQAAIAAIPPAHLEFLERLEPWLTTDEHLVVHAGIRPGRRLAEQDEEDLFWIREEFIAHPHDLGLTVVFGHTPVRNVLVDLPYKVGIDTGCVYGGKLTAFELREQRLHQVTLGQRDVRVSPLPPSSRDRHQPARA
jgi:serine/threonine protein phosphatase 1